MDTNGFSVIRVLMLFFIIISILIVAIIGYFYFQSYWTPRSDNKQSLGSGFYRNSKHIYFIDKCLRVDILSGLCTLYELKIMPEIDAVTFKVVKEPYFKDKFTVYRYSQKIIDADPNTFIVLNLGYSKDGHHVFNAYDGETYIQSPENYNLVKILVNADAETFQVFSTHAWAKDKNHVYHWGEITDLDAQSFQQLGPGTYYKDKNKVIYYFYGQVLDLDPAYSELINDRTIKDQKNIYVNDKLVQGNFDVKTFTPIENSGFSKDVNYVYFDNQPLIGADPATFRQIWQLIYADKTHVYQKTIKGVRMLDDVDPNTIKVLECEYISDANSVYYAYSEMPFVKLPNSDPLTFTVTSQNQCIAKDKNQTYQNGKIVESANP